MINVKLPHIVSNLNISNTDNIIFLRSELHRSKFVINEIDKIDNLICGFEINLIFFCLIEMNCDINER